MISDIKRKKTFNIFNRPANTGSILRKNSNYHPEDD